MSLEIIQRTVFKQHFELTATRGKLMTSPRVFNEGAVQETLRQIQAWSQELKFRGHLDRLLPQAMWHNDFFPTPVKRCPYHSMEPARAPTQAVLALEQFPRPPFENLVRKLVCYGCHSLFSVFGFCRNCHLRLCFRCLRDRAPIVNEPKRCGLCCIGSIT